MDYTRIFRLLLYWKSYRIFVPVWLLFFVYKMDYWKHFSLLQKLL